jgi:putative glutamine amidotransferase
MNAPLIGITTSKAPRNSDGMVIATVPYTYVQAVQMAGGLPVLIPLDLPADQYPVLRERLDGLMLSGGADIDPARFNGVPHPRVYDMDPARDELELGLSCLAAESGWPLLGICRGVQVMNVALGGSLYTDLADQLPGALRHDWYPGIPRTYLAHTVRLEKGSILAANLGDGEVPVNSLHHQGIRHLAPGLRALAWAPDSVIEAVELPGHPCFLGVQWHPESLVGTPAMLNLFRAFIRACS